MHDRNALRKHHSHPGRAVWRDTPRRMEHEHDYTLSPSASTSTCCDRPKRKCNTTASTSSADRRTLKLPDPLPCPRLTAAQSYIVDKHMTSNEHLRSLTLDIECFQSIVELESAMAVASSSAQPALTGALIEFDRMRMRSADHDDREISI